MYEELQEEVRVSLLQALLLTHLSARNEESSELRSLPQYLEEVRHILALVLQIPPVDPSTGLRTYYLLRLTGDVFCSITGYRVHQATGQDGLSRALSVDLSAVRDVLQDLIDFLDDLDQAWLAVLEGQVWDPESAEGVDLASGLSNITLHTDDEGAAMNDDNDVKTTLPNQTDTTRLRSLLVGGESALEEWLLDQRFGDSDLPGTLQSMGLLDDFDNLFVRTLSHLGEFKGEDIQEALDERMDLGEEVPMSEPFGYKLPDPDPED